MFFVLSKILAFLLAPMLHSLFLSAGKWSVFAYAKGKTLGKNLPYSGSHFAPSL